MSVRGRDKTCRSCFRRMRSRCLIRFEFLCRGPRLRTSPHTERLLRRRIDSTGRWWVAEPGQGESTVYRVWTVARRLARLDRPIGTISGRWRRGTSQLQGHAFDNCSKSSSVIEMSPVVVRVLSRKTGRTRMPSFDRSGDSFRIRERPYEYCPITKQVFLKCGSPCQERGFLGSAAEPHRTRARACACLDSF
jgi:hypothetical protein